MAEVSGAVPGARSFASVRSADFHPDGPGLSDADLISAVGLGRGEAYAELYRRYSRSVTSASRMILGNSPACEDIVAEVFVKFWLTPERFDPGRGSLVGFLRLKARNRSIDVLRSETSRKRRERNDVHVGPVPQPDLDSNVVASETSSAVHLAVAALPAKERDAIRLAFFTGMSYQAVALHLKEPEGTVKSRIKSGLVRLRLTSSLVGPLRAIESY